MGNIEMLNSYEVSGLLGERSGHLVQFSSVAKTSDWRSLVIVGKMDH